MSSCAWRWAVRTGPNHLPKLQGSSLSMLDLRFIAFVTSTGCIRCCLCTDCSHPAVSSRPSVWLEPLNLHRSTKTAHHYPCSRN